MWRYVTTKGVLCSSVTHFCPPLYVHWIPLGGETVLCYTTAQGYLVIYVRKQPEEVIQLNKLTCTAANKTIT